MDNPQNPYGISKQCEERIAIHLGRRYQIPTVALRYSIVQGPRQSFRNAYSGACRVFSLSYYQKQQPIVYEDGRQLRDFVNIKDVVAANLLALDTRAPIIRSSTLAAVSTIPCWSLRAPWRMRTEWSFTRAGRPFPARRHSPCDFGCLQAARFRLGAIVAPAESVRQYREWLLAEVPSADIVGESQARMKKLGVIGYAAAGTPAR